MSKTKEELAFEVWNSKRLNNLVFTPETSEEDREFLKKKYAFLAGFHAAEPKWIPVSERLPEDTCADYLIFIVKSREWWSTQEISETERKQTKHRSVEKRIDFEYFDEEEWRERGVTHWMPLPAPPKEEDEK